LSAQLSALYRLISFSVRALFEPVFEAVEYVNRADACRLFPVLVQAQVKTGLDKIAAVFKVTFAHRMIHENLIDRLDGFFSYCVIFTTDWTEYVFGGGLLRIYPERQVCFGTV